MMPRDQFKSYSNMSITAFPVLAVTVHDQIAEDAVGRRGNAFRRLYRACNDGIRGF